MHRARLSVFATGTALAALLLAGCSTPAPSTPDEPSAGPDAPSSPAPAWYGDDFDGDGCPVPADGSDLARADDAAAFLQADVPADWCVYKSATYTQYFAIPATEVADFGTVARSVLEPAGWAFDAPDDDSPQWSWITAYPDGAAADFEDGSIDGSIFTEQAITQEDMDTYAVWYGSLFEAFGDWSEGDYVSIVGFW